MLPLVVIIRDGMAAAAVLVVVSSLVLLLLGNLGEMLFHFHERPIAMRNRVLGLVVHLRMQFID
jgi:hypothetical protein